MSRRNGRYSRRGICCSRLVDLDSDIKQQQLELLVTRQFVQFLSQPSGIHFGTVVEDFEIISQLRQSLPRLNPVQVPAFRSHGGIVSSAADVD